MKLPDVIQRDLQEKNTTDLFLTFHLFLTYVMSYLSLTK